MNKQQIAKKWATVRGRVIPASRQLLFRASSWLSPRLSRLNILIRRTLREPPEVTITRLDARKDREDATTVELRAVLEAKIALTASKEVNALLRKEISAVGKKVKEPETVPSSFVRGRKA